MSSKVCRLFAGMLLLFVLTPQGNQRAVGQGSYGKGPKNVIFMIGDGMGLGHMTAYDVHLGGATGCAVMEKLPIVGLVKTFSASELVTDSAAAGTALACGVKTRNGIVGLDTESQPFTSIMELARDQGKATGVAVTCGLPHATPASFLSHVESRGHQSLIAEQMLAARPDVLLGGGKEYFIPRSARGSARADDLDLLGEARDQGYTVVESADQLDDLEAGPVLGVFATGALQVSPPEPSLADMTAKAIELLAADPDGFMLMVEGSQIDWAAHANNANEVIRHMASFDEAVEVALSFTESRDDTLLLVTADHETGGFAITTNEGPTGDSVTIYRWVSTHHTAEMVPLLAAGLGANRFSGVYQNTSIPKRIADLWGYEKFPVQSEASFKLAPESESAGISAY